MQRAHPALFARSQDPLAISLLVLPETSLMTLAATVDSMRAANRVAGREVYRWEIVSLDGTPPATSSGLPIPVDVPSCPPAAATCWWCSPPSTSSRTH